jgi:hypothetical protein
VPVGIQPRRGLGWQSYCRNLETLARHAQEGTPLVAEAKVGCSCCYGGDDDVLGKAYDGRLLLRLFSCCWPCRRQLILAVIWMAVSTVLLVSGPWVVGQAIDSIAAGEVGQLQRWGAVLAGVVLFEVGDPTGSAFICIGCSAARVWSRICVPSCSDICTVCR